MKEFSLGNFIGYTEDGYKLLRIGETFYVEDSDTLRPLPEEDLRRELAEDDLGDDFMVEDSEDFIRCYDPEDGELLAD